MFSGDAAKSPRLDSLEIPSDLFRVGRQDDLGSGRQPEYAVEVVVSEFV